MHSRSLGLLSLFFLGLAFDACGIDLAAPSGWAIEKRLTMPDDARAQIGDRWGCKLVSVINVIYSVAGSQCQVNEIVAASDADADKVAAALLRLKGDPSSVLRDGTKVYELVCRDARLLRTAKDVFGFQPPVVTYRVSFTCAPLVTCNAMALNRMFNLFLELDRTQDAEAAGVIRAQIAGLREQFEFGNELTLRRHGLGDRPIAFTFDPAPQSTVTLEEQDAVTYRFANLPVDADVPRVRVEAIVTSDRAGPSQTAPTPGASSLGANRHWPSAAPEIVRLAAEITADIEASDKKVAALLGWFRDPANMRYGGGVTGSRYGVAKVLEQRVGHCWDYADLFVTLCRATGVPARAVAGWLHRESGHVWAEVFIDGGWRQVDPTSGMAAGSDYVPYITLVEGEFPLLYVSPVTIDIVPTPGG